METGERQFKQEDTEYKGPAAQGTASEAAGSSGVGVLRTACIFES